MKLMFLDRDGVINYDSESYIKSPEEWIPIPRSLQAIDRLHRAGYHIVVLTNQSGVGRGYYTLATLAAIHAKMRRMTGDAIKAVFFCPHLPTDQCACRKPKPGLFYQAAHYFQTDLTGIPAVGDAPRDIQAAEAVGCRPYWVGKESQYPDLLAVVEHLLEHT